MTDPMRDEQETAWDAAVKAHEATLVIGARVRIAPGECRYWEDVWGVSTHEHISDRGMTGTVTFIGRPEYFRDELDHRFFVSFDQSVPFTCVAGYRATITSGMYAAVELLVLRAADPDEEGED